MVKLPDFAKALDSATKATRKLEHAHDQAHELASKAEKALLQTKKYEQLLKAALGLAKELNAAQCNTPAAKHFLALIGR